MGENVTSQQAYDFARRRMNTDGQFNGVYLYPYGGNIPADHVTLAKDLTTAISAVVNDPAASKYRYAF